jgi:hypothetical protein
MAKWKRVTRIDGVLIDINMDRFAYMYPSILKRKCFKAHWTGMECRICNSARRILELKRQIGSQLPNGAVASTKPGPRANARGAPTMG